MITNSLCICVFDLLIITLIFCSAKVAAQEGPGTVIAHPGQNVELLCSVTVTSNSQTAAWLINNMGPYRVNAIRGGVQAGYTATLGSHNLIVENIMMNDDRNGSNYRCAIVPSTGTFTFENIVQGKDSTILYVAGIPAMVPGVTVDNSTININGNNVTLTLSWGEPFNNLDPIVNYTVSCSGDDTCPPNFTTTDNTTRSHNITNLTPITNYTFSVVATNSIGSGEAGVVMITTPGVPAMVPVVTVDDSTIIINGNNVTLTLSWGEPFNNLDPIVNYTVSCSGNETCPPNFTTTTNITRSHIITNLTLMTNYTFSVVATNSIGSGEAGVLMITTLGVPAKVPGVSGVYNTININRNNVTLTLSWGEPFNNFDPIVNYTVSCSGNETCPLNFTTTNNATRSHTITNLTLMTNYTFSVVATNSIGSGEAGVLMITTPGVPAMVSGVTVDDNTININGNNVTLTLSWEEPFDNFDPIVNYTVSCSGDNTCPPNFTTTARSQTITNLTLITNYTFSVVATNSIGSGEAGVFMIATPDVPAMVPGVTVVDNTININGNNVTLTLSWGESFNNLDPIVNYTVSCSGNDTCPPNFTTTDNTTRSYTITNLTPMTNYTFSVVATNSIGSGEAGVVMITTPSGMNTSATTIDMNTSTISMDTSTMIMDMNTFTTTIDMNTSTTTIDMNTSTMTIDMNTSTMTIDVNTSTTTIDMNTSTTTIDMNTSTMTIDMNTFTTTIDMNTSTTTIDMNTSTTTIDMNTSTTTIDMNTSMMTIDMNTSTTTIDMNTSTTTIDMNTSTTTIDMNTSTTMMDMKTFTSIMMGNTTVTSMMVMTPEASIMATTRNTPKINMTISTSTIGVTSAVSSTAMITTTNVLTPRTSKGVGITTSADDNSTLIVAIIVVIVVLVLCCCIIMNILFCFCCKRKEQCDQSYEEDGSYKTMQCSIIVLGVLTCGTSVLLWWLFKGCCTSKEKYNVKGHSAVPASSKSSKKYSRKDKNTSSKSTSVEMTDDASIQGSPTEFTSETIKPFDEATHTEPALQYDYVRTGPVTVVDGTFTIQPTSRPKVDSYAMTEILPEKDKKKDKKKKDGKTKANDKSQQSLEYAVVDKSKKHTKQQKPELNYLDPSNIEFAKEPHNHVTSMDHHVEYADVVDSTKNTNV